MSDFWKYDDTLLELGVQDMAEAVPLGMHIIDRDERLIYANSAWFRHMNIGPEEALGQRLTQVLSQWNYYPMEYYHIDLESGQANEIKSCDSPALEALETGKRVSVITGSHYPNRCIVTSTPLKNKEGVVFCVITLIQDAQEFSDLKRMIEEYAEQQALLKGMIDHLQRQIFAGPFIGESRKIRYIRELITQVAGTDVPVMINGETGTGKELVAEELVKASDRAGQPFIRVNCASIPEQLAEAEFFGYERGAFTGALKDGKRGYFELANQGTIFLDEVGDLPLHLQPKLLRAIQQKEIFRVGASKTIKIDVRIIAATNRDLKRMVRQGTFREDLYYRLTVINIFVPPLRLREGDIDLLALFFLKEMNKKYGKDKRFSQAALIALNRYDWPGNVREMRNLVERMVLLGDEKEISGEWVTKQLLQDSMPEEAEADGVLTLREAVQDYERRLIQQALDTYGTVRKAAVALSVPQTTLVRKVKEFGIQRRKSADK